MHAVEKKLLGPSHSSFRFVRAPSPGRIVPLSWLPPSFRICGSVSCANSDGIAPVSWFTREAQLLQVCQAPQLGGDRPGESVLVQLQFRQVGQPSEFRWDCARVIDPLSLSPIWN